MSNEIEIRPRSGPVEGQPELPGSKSHTNRALLCAGLARGTSTLHNVLIADDTKAMMDSLRRLGVDVSVENSSAVLSGGLTLADDTIVKVDARQSGTTSRFILPVLAATQGNFVLDGDVQLRRRPFMDQIRCLGQLGARIDGEKLPLSVSGSAAIGGSCRVPGAISSQFLSGLLLAAPLMDGVEIVVDGLLVSQPYVDLTIATMQCFGVEVQRLGYEKFRVEPGDYQPTELVVEPDATAASYFLAAAAIVGGRVRIAGLGANSVQGDVRFAQLLAEMGADVEIGPDTIEVRRPAGRQLVGIDVDMADISDTVQTLAMVAVFAESPTTMRQIGFIRRKETDRIGAVVAELQKLGIRCEADADSLTVFPGQPSGGNVATYADHRMAMSFALLGLRTPGIRIEDPDCVTKTFPNYFAVLENL